ncbi:F-box protein CPR1-like [Papaver somniferum]|uniref:F-box protein CPR1-like n=1 Tax=Papaver somniferum TaxID=3469 RepID=UPI000E6F864A|nr:F-box protein CPR1-like [Papaver somniferum]
MSSIPEEIYHEILLSLPVKSLLICKSVCKNWYSLISTSDFVQLHLHFTTQRNNPILMLEGSPSDKVLNFIGYDSLASSVCEFEDAAIEMHYPFKSSLHYHVRLVGSCNGLVCILLVDNDFEGFLCLWNPATREYKKIAIPSFSIMNYEVAAFGYAHKTDDYKLVVGFMESGALLIKDSTLVQVYTLASNSWEPRQTVPYQFPYYMQRHGVLVNGDFHWLAIAQDKFFLLCLDISDESFKELQLLPIELLDQKHNPCINLGVLEGCLCVIFTSSVNDVTIHREVWEMLDYGVQESWTRRYIITHENIIRNLFFYVSPLWCYENGKILFMNAGRLVLYDPEHGSARELHEHRNVSRLAGNYIESLVSLKSGTYVGGEGRIEELRET